MKCTASSSKTTEYTKYDQTAADRNHTFTVQLPLPAQEKQNLQDLKRPRYSIKEFQNTMLPDQGVAHKEEQQQTLPDNNRFSGKFNGIVTVHYKDRMVRTQASLTVTTETDTARSHYDYYILPEKGEYLESKWPLNGSEVQRTVTISENTIYVTDIISYESGGGNSQIRTLVFSEDFSAMTFLKTEFDDAVRDTATGQIIGRFNRLQ